nr:TetR family transcriptional regulator [Actinomycetales bacterium]
MDGNMHPTRRRLDADHRRAAILASARERYAAALFPEVSVADVAASAGASPALVHHYFGSKSELYAAVVAEGIAEFSERQQQADAALPSRTPARERIRTMLGVYLDHVAAFPEGWASPLVGGEEPREAVRLRQGSRARSVETLTAMLRPEGRSRREEFALIAFFGFVDEACLAWVAGGCRVEEREPVLEACLGALEGALGDWGR